MQYKCGLTINNEETDSCKECIYNGFEKKEECYNKQMEVIEEMTTTWEKPWIFCGLDELIDSCE